MEVELATKYVIRHPVGGSTTFPRPLPSRRVGPRELLCFTSPNPLSPGVPFSPGPLPLPLSRTPN